MNYFFALVFLCFALCQYLRVTGFFLLDFRLCLTSVRCSILSTSETLSTVQLVVRVVMFRWISFTYQSSAEYSVECCISPGCIVMQNLDVCFRGDEMHATLNAASIW